MVQTRVLVLLVAMILFHLLDDYKIQGILSQMKQRDWWAKNALDELYKHDYIMALAEHAFSWTVMVHIPAWVYAYLYGAKQLLGTYIIAFLLCWLIHAVTDHAKANMHKINLVEDQLIHLFQVVVLWLLYT